MSDLDTWRLFLVVLFVTSCAVFISSIRPIVNRYIEGYRRWRERKKRK